MDEKKCFKQCHYTRADAKKQKRELNKKHGRKAKITNVYYCKMCCAYHLTSMDSDKSRAMNKKDNHDEK